MEQRSPEWFEARKGVITGSRVGSILGVNPYAKPEDVMREMVREHFGAEKEFKGNAATNHGERLEPVALACYEREAKVSVTQTGFVKHDDHDWLGASPDGLVGIDGGLEIKCPYWAKEPYSVHDKPSYYAQCQHVMEVCDIEWMDFFCYINDDTFLMERLERDRNWFKNALPTLRDFRQRYLDFIRDEVSAEKYLKDIVSSVTDKRASRLVELFDLIRDSKVEIAPLEEEFDRLKKELGTEFGTFQTGNLKVTRTDKRGAVDSKKLYKDINLESLLSANGKTLDDYRKEPIVSFSVSVVEKE